MKKIVLPAEALGLTEEAWRLAHAVPKCQQCLGDIPPGAKRCKHCKQRIVYPVMPNPPVDKVAGFLSFFCPGLGQIVGGQKWWKGASFFIMVPTLYLGFCFFGFALHIACVLDAAVFSKRIEKDVERFVEKCLGKSEWATTGETKVGPTEKVEKRPRKQACDG